MSKPVKWTVCAVLGAILVGAGIGIGQQGPGRGGGFTDQGIGRVWVSGQGAEAVEVDRAGAIR